jgi:hypothetical protein
MFAVQHVHRASHDAKNARFGVRPHGSCMGDWCVGRRLVGWQARRHHHHRSPAKLLLILHSFSPSSPEHALLAGFGTVAHPQLPINSGLQTACTELVCACGGVVSATLARDSKVTRCLLCIYSRGFRISKRLPPLSLTAQNKNSPSKHRYPTTGHFIVTSTTPNPLPNHRWFCCEAGRRVADRENSALRRDGIPTSDRAQRAARARANSYCRP